MQFFARIKQLKPLLLFFGIYTGLFILFDWTLDYTLPFVVGFFLALLMQPLIRLLHRRLHMPHSAASLVATLAVYVLLFLLLVLLVLALIREGQKLISWIGSLSSSALDQWLAPLYRILEKTGTWLQNVAPGFAADSKQAVSDFLRMVLGFAGNTAKQTLSLITSVPMMLMMVVVSILSTYFFSRDMEHIRAHVRRIFSSGQAGQLRALSQNSKAMGGRLILSYLLIYGLTFLESLIVFSVLGVPYPLVFAILSGIADVLPVLGPGTVYLPMAVVYLCLGNWPVAIILAVCWLIVSAIRQIVEPKIVAKSINIHPLAMLAAIYIALVAGSFSVFLYAVILLFLYQVLVQNGILLPLSRALEAPRADEKSSRTGI